MKTVGNYKFNYYTGKWERNIFSTYRWLVWLSDHANHVGEIKRKFGHNPAYVGGLLL